MVVYRAKLFSHAGKQFDYYLAVCAERNLARVVELDQRAAEIEEQRRVAIRIGHRNKSLLRVTPIDVVANVREYFVEDRDAGLGLRLGNNQRGIDSNLGEIAHDHQPALEAFGEYQLSDFFAEQFFGLEIANQLDANHQSLAADVADELVLLLELHQPRQHHRANLARVLDQMLFLNRANRLRHRHRRERISAVARRRRARLREWLRLAQFVTQQHARNRISGTHSLADGDDIRANAAVLDAPPFSGPSEAGDHFVGDQQRAEILGHRFDRRHPVVGRNHVAGGALHRLRDDRSERAAGTHLDLLAREIDAVKPALGMLQLERASVAVRVWHRVLPALQRSVALLRFVADKSDHAAGLAVEAAPETHNFVLAGRRTRQPKGGFDRLRAAAI